MKWLFFALLAANLGLAAFAYVRDRMPNPDTQLVKQQMNADQIRIVAPRPAPPSAPVTAAPAQGVCVEWGRFGGAEVPRVQAALDKLALGEGARRTEVAVKTSYWVYIPPLKSRSDMERKVNELRERGVNDYASILESGRWRYAIALGVFRSEDAAEKLLAQLREKGVRSAQVGEREQRIVQTAFLVRDPTEEQSAQLADLKAGFRGSELRVVECPPP